LGTVMTSAVVTIAQELGGGGETVQVAVGTTT